MANKKARRIPTPVFEPNVNTLKFSFKYLDLHNDKFSLNACTCEFWEALIREIHEYSQMAVDAFLDQNHQQRRHVIDFSETTEQLGFSHLDTEQLVFEESWQFQVGSNGPWRVSGFLVDDTFFIVWLDPGHRLYV